MMWNPSDRFALSARRCERFFGSAGKPDCGVCAHFERIGDQLYDTDAIARVLADRVTGGYDTVIEHFRFSLRTGRFGPPASSGRFAAPETLNHHQRRRVYNLIDLYSAVSPQARPEPGLYALRPSVPIADAFAPDMRARQSVWAHWIAGQGWPVPPEFGAPLIEGKATVVDDGQRALPAPRTSRAVDAEAAAGQWLRAHQGQPKMTKAKALGAIKADIGPLLSDALSNSAFRRAWRADADPRWRKAGAPRKNNR